MRDPVCCIQRTLPVCRRREKRNLVVGDWAVMMCHTLTGNCVGHWQDWDSAGNRFLYLFSQNAPHYPQTGSITGLLLSGQLLISIRSTKQRSDPTDQFLLVMAVSQSTQSKAVQSSIPGLSTELIITTTGIIFQPLG